MNTKNGLCAYNIKSNYLCLLYKILIVFASKIYYIFVIIFRRISQNKLTALLKHYVKNGLTPRQKKSGGRKYNTKALTVADTERVVMFLRNFAEDHGVNLPGRVPGFKRADIKLLPTSQTKSSIWRLYHELTSLRGNILSFPHVNLMQSHHHHHVWWSYFFTIQDF